MNASASTVIRKAMIGQFGAASRAWRAGLFCAVACVALLATAPAHAQAADEEKSFDEKIIDSILKGAGLRDDSANIEYRERSPLVIPPGNTLPSPAQSAASNNPNWPVDPEIKRARAAKTAETSFNATGDKFLDESRPLTPNELARGRRAGAGVGTFSDRDPSKPLRPNELGAKRGIFGALFDKDEETAPFTGEPPRASLVSPPRGYQTPSPTQPYGVGGAKAAYGSNTSQDNYTSRSEVRP